jgi:hypothetical protein
VHDIELVPDKISHVQRQVSGLSEVKDEWAASADESPQLKREQTG